MKIRKTESTFFFNAYNDFIKTLPKFLGKTSPTLAEGNTNT